MPTLEIPNLAALRVQSILQRTPIGPQTANVTIAGQPQPGSPPSCYCQPGLQLCVEQGATLNSQLALTVTDANGVKQPLDITGFNFEFTAKTDPSIPDSDPSVVEVDWTETATPTAGTTWLTVPATVTAGMQALPYFYQLRMIQSPTSPTPIVTPLFSGTLLVIQPVSTRH